MSVGIVVVSHSRALAEAAVELARQMLPGRELAVEVAAGTEDGGLGTDAMAVSAAIEAADSGEGTVVLMDLGSAVLSAETALEFLPDDVRSGRRSRRRRWSRAWWGPWSWRRAGRPRAGGRRGGPRARAEGGPAALRCPSLCCDPPERRH